MKSQLIFLMELMLLAGIVIMVTSIGYRQVSSDGHIYTFEITNLPLLLERATIIEGNFEYIYTFQQPTSLEIKDGSILLDRPRRENKRFYQETNLDLPAVKYDNVTEIYIFKEGETLHISHQRVNINPKKKAVEKETRTMYFFSEDDIISDFIRSQEKFTVLSTIQENLDGPLIIFTESEINDKIMHTVDTNNLANAIFNAYNGDIRRYPIQKDFSVIHIYAKRNSINNLVQIDG